MNEATAQIGSSTPHVKKRRGGFKDRTGVKYSRLTVIREVEPKNGEVRWLCRCDCGNEKVLESGQLASGKSKSCGCLMLEIRAKGVAGGGENHPLFRTWRGIKYRCENPGDKSYQRYGGRGIQVCERWSKTGGLRNFIEDMGPKPSPRHSIDRIDNNGNYEPGNCRWASSEEQDNNRRDNIWIEYNGERHTAAQWERIIGLRRKSIYGRLKNGWPLERVLKPSTKKILE